MARVQIAPRIDAAVLAQFHAAEYAAERNSVDVWKTLQYALVPIMFGAWYLLSQVRNVLPGESFYWLSALVVPLCLVAYQKAMVDALTGVLLIEQMVRPLAIQLAGSDQFWLHEPVYRKAVPSDAAYAWQTPPLLAFGSPMAMLAYHTVFVAPVSWQDLLGYFACVVGAGFVGKLSKKGLLLNRRIDECIRNSNLACEIPLI
jgi:hypothetical protein